MKITFDTFLGNTFFSDSEITCDGVTIPAGTKFTLVARLNNNGQFIYKAHIANFAPAGY